MLYKNIRFAFRQLGKNKVFSFINVLGLSLSMVACLLIYKYVNFEQQYDTHHDDVDQIYRIYRLEEGEDPDDGVVQVFSGMKIPLETNLPDIKHVSRFIGYDKIFQSFAFTHFAADGVTRTFNIPKGFFSDQGALSILKFDWIEGGDMASLNNPNEVVISESYAKKFFGNTSSVGKVLRFKNMAADFKVTGVYADLPTSTHLKFDMLCSMKSLPTAWDLDRKYDWGNFFTYAKTLPRWSEPGLDLDRIDNDRGYEPGNLRLVSRRANANNRRGNVRHEGFGREWSAREVHEEFCHTWVLGTDRYPLAKERRVEWVVARYRKKREGV